MSRAAALTKISFTSSSQVDRSNFNKCTLVNGNNTPVEIGFTNVEYINRSSYAAHQLAFRLDVKQFKHLQEIYLHIQKQCTLPDMEWKELVTNPEYGNCIWTNWTRKFTNGEGVPEEMDVEVEV